MREALADEQVQARDMIIEVKHPVYGIIREVAAPIKTDGAITAPAPAPRLGEHPDEILRDLLHYGDEHIDGCARQARSALPAPASPETIGPAITRMAIEKVAPETDVEDVTQGAVTPPWMTILHNCECHTFEQVVRQLQKAIACSEAEGWEIAWQVHNTGKAVVKVGAETECVRVGNILASIGLVVTVVQS